MVKVNKTTPKGQHILKNIYLSFFYGAKIGIIGLNGSGKSTVMKIIAGIDTAFQGDVVWSNDGYSVGYLPQEPTLDPNKTVKEIIQEGVQETVDLLAEFEEINNSFMDEEIMNDPDKMQKLIDRQGAVQDKIDACNGWEIDRTLDIAADALRLPPWDADVSTLSGGEKRRVALCRLLLSKPDMLLLDEPTNHLDAESVAWLERFLEEYSGTVIAVTHDRYFLDNVAGWILELDRGHGIPWEGNYSSWLDQKSQRLEQEEKTEKSRQKAMKEELEWSRSSAKGRQAKGKARMQKFEELMSQEKQTRNETKQLYIPAGPRLGDKVIIAEDVSKGFGDRLLYENLNFNLPRGGIVGIIGANGAGKSTLFKMITGEEQPDSGSLQVGETVQLAYVNQSMLAVLILKVRNNKNT